MIVRSKEKIKELQAVIQEELDNLPAYDVFGHSNAEGKEESQEWIDELQYAYDNDRIADIESDVGYWLEGSKYSTLGKDYGVDN